MRLCLFRAGLPARARRIWGRGLPIKKNLLLSVRLGGCLPPKPPDGIFTRMKEVWLIFVLGGGQEVRAPCAGDLFGLFPAPLGHFSVVARR